MSNTSTGDESDFALDIEEIGELEVIIIGRHIVRLGRG